MSEKPENKEKCQLVSLSCCHEEFDMTTEEGRRLLKEHTDIFHREPSPWSVWGRGDEE